ncbi:MAG: hypothetical protein P4L59_19715 [Desulfosporosinus sp.]|nr:hypothetical protein [Desulfosporosinus sp.]
MDYKSVLQEQIRELQKLQDATMQSKDNLIHKVDNAVKIAEQIRVLCKDARGSVN